MTLFNFTSEEYEILEIVDDKSFIRFIVAHNWIPIPRVDSSIHRPSTIFYRNTKGEEKREIISPYYGIYKYTFWERVENIRRMRENLKLLNETFDGSLEDYIKKIKDWSLKSGYSNNN